MAGNPLGHFNRPPGATGAVKGTQFVSKATAEEAGYTLASLHTAVNAGTVSEGELSTLAAKSQQPKGQAKRKPGGLSEADILALDQQGVKLSAMTTATGADPNVRFQMTHKLVDLADLTASNTPGGSVNPNYPSELQPRDRSRDASQAQIATIAAQLNPDALISDIGRIDAGSPVVDSAGNVLSGNGRTLALQQATPAKLAEYRDRLKAQAESLGIDPNVLDQMKNPVLVRVLSPGADRVQFARAANSSGVLRMSPLEQSAVDAKTLADKAVLKLHVGEGNIDAALRSGVNKPFVDDFLAMVPANERANLLTRNGTLNQLGLYRAKAALFSKAFPGDAGTRLAEAMLESLDADLKNVQTGISGALTAISRASSLIKAGERSASLDLTEDFAKTIDVLARIRDNADLTVGTKMSEVVDKYLNQSSFGFFERELNPDQEKLLRYVDSISRKPTEVRAMFQKWASIVEKAPEVGQVSFGGMGGMSKSELIDALTSTAPASVQGGMF